MTDSLAENTRWVEALRALSDVLVSDADTEDTLAEIAGLIRGWLDADATLVFLPSLDDLWTCEFAAGEQTDCLIGMRFPPLMAFADSFSTGEGALYENPADSPFDGVPALGAYGPIVVIPLMTNGEVNGAFLVLRESAGEPFSSAEFALAKASAREVTLVLRLAEAEQVKGHALLLEERERISRDLHDYVIQEIFGAGIGLDRLRAQAEARQLSSSAMVDGLKTAMKSLEDSVLQIRRIVYTLRESSADHQFNERLEDEASRARTILGFAPSLVFELDGVPLSPSEAGAEQKIRELCARVPGGVADDGVAMVRESLSNVARHAHARSVSVTVAVSGKGIVGELIITVYDDGTGIDPSLSRTSGLDNIGRRAANHGGSFAFGAGPRRRGTSLIWRVPLG